MASRLTPEAAESVRRGPDRSAWDKIAEQCRKLNAFIVAPGSPGYPVPLLELKAPPPLLFMLGCWKIRDMRAVAIVGTRNPTPYGTKAAFGLAGDFAQAGMTVVSGLAVGIDTGAHTGALDGEGRTIAVIGCGLDISYPPENQKLRERIALNGAVVSEFPPGSHPNRVHFPRRNRILSALAAATVVVEAGNKSGALLTAAHARAQGKHLFALPGSIFSPVSSGTHALLRRGAMLATSAEDILTIVNGGGTPQVASVVPEPSTAPVRRMELPPVENEPVLELWREEDTCTLDRLVDRAGEMNLWPTAKALASLMESLLQLEIRGLVQRLPGPIFRKRVLRQGLPLQRYG